MCGRSLVPAQESQYGGMASRHFGPGEPTVCPPFGGRFAFWNRVDFRPDLVTSTIPPMGLPLNASALIFVIFVFRAAALLLATVAKRGGVRGGWTMYRRVGINGSVF